MSDTPPAAWASPQVTSVDQIMLAAANHSASTSAPRDIAASQPAQTVVNDTPVRPVKIIDKLTCTGPDGCKSSMVAAGCSRQWCKRCCLRQMTPCGFRAHDQARMSLRTGHSQGNVDPFQLTQPPPAIPPTPFPPTPSTVPHADDVQPLSGGTDLDSTPAPRFFRMPMPMSLQQDWDTRHAVWMGKAGITDLAAGESERGDQGELYAHFYVCASTLTCPLGQVSKDET